jgi:uncharacterized protein
MASADPRPLAIVTGASTGIGYELAAQCAANGFDLPITADRAGNRESGGEAPRAGRRGCGRSGLTCAPPAGAAS